MIGLLARLIGGALTPLTDQFSDFSARLLRKLALFFVAAICLLVVLIALTIAFDLWVTTYHGAIAGVLAVAGVYLTVAALAVFFALRKPQAVRGGETGPASEHMAAAAKAQDDQIDAFTAPLLIWLQRLGLRREQMAVLAGASVAKQLGPLPLVGLAILAGFMVGRLATSWRSLVPLGLVDDLLTSGIFGFGAGRQADAEEEA